MTIDLMNKQETAQWQYCNYKKNPDKPEIYEVTELENTGLSDLISPVM